MIAVYKGNKYKFVLNKRRKGIITRCVQKTDGSFFKENDIYYKPVDEKDLSDIYAVEFYVFFDTGFKDVSTWWKITEAVCKTVTSETLWVRVPPCRFYTPVAQWTEHTATNRGVRSSNLFGSVLP